MWDIFGLQLFPFLFVGVGYSLNSLVLGVRCDFHADEPIRLEAFLGPVCVILLFGQLGRAS